MISSTPVTVFGLVAGNIAGFLAKQYVLINGLETVRRTIDQIVSKTAKEQFGTWVGTIFGHQAGLVLALPVTSFIGDVVWGCVTEVIHSTITCSARTFGVIKPCMERLSTAVLIAIRVCTAMIAYGVKALILQFSYPYVQVFLEIMLPKVLPALCRYSFFQFYLKPFLTFSAVMVLTTPAALILADICGLIVQELLYYIAVKLFTPAASPPPPPVKK